MNPGDVHRLLASLSDDSIRRLVEIVREHTRLSRDYYGALNNDQTAERQRISERIYELQAERDAILEAATDDDR